MLAAVAVLSLSAALSASGGRGAPGASSLAPPEREPLLVLDTDARLLPAARDLAGQLPSSIARLLEAYRQIQPVTGDDVRALSSLEARRQEAGCDTSCAVEIANALGARHVVVSQLLRDPLGMRLALSLIDGDGGSVVGRSSIAGANSAELLAQLPFAVDAVVASLRHPDDPPVGSVVASSASLAVLPLRFVGAPFAEQAKLKSAVAAAAVAAAERLRLGVVDEAATVRLVTAAGCAADDPRCGLPLLAMNGARLALRVSVARGERVVVRASLLKPDGSAAGEAERSLDGAVAADRVVAAVVTVVDEACGPGDRRAAARRPLPVPRLDTGSLRPPTGDRRDAPIGDLPQPAPAPSDPAVRHVADADDDDSGRYVAPDHGSDPAKDKAPKAKPRTFVARVTCGKRVVSGPCVVADDRVVCRALSSSKGGFVFDVALGDIEELRETAGGFRLLLPGRASCALDIDDRERARVGDWLKPDRR